MDALLLVFFVPIVFYVLADVANRFVSYRNASLVLRQMAENKELPSAELSYTPPASPEQSSDNPKKTIAMIAPFGLSKKMTARARMIPMALSLIENGYSVSVYIPAWDTPEAKLNELEAKDFLGALEIINIKPTHFLPVAFDPFLFWRLYKNVLFSRAQVLYSFKPVGYSGAVAYLSYQMRRVGLLGNSTFERILVDADDWEGTGGWADRTDISFLSRHIRNLEEQLVLRSCDAVTVVSKELQRIVSEMRNGQSVYYVPNGIRVTEWLEETRTREIPDDLVQELENLDDPPVVLLYTRFAEFNVERLVEIFGFIVREVPTTVLLIVGESFDERSRKRKLELMSLLSKRRIREEHVIRIGWVDYPDLPRYWAAAHVAIHLLDDNLVNHTKSMTKVLELMATCMPVVADSVGEVKQIIQHRKSGILVSPGDNEEFAKAVVHLLQNETLRQQIGRAACKRACDNFNWSKIVGTVIEAIEGGDIDPSVSSWIPANER